MASTTIANNIFGKCTAALGVDSSRCDGMTALTIEPTTANQLASIYKGTAPDTWRLMNFLLESDFVGKSCFPRDCGMYDFIQATTRFAPKRVNLSKINNGLYELFPFLKMERKSPINNEFWTASGGAAGSGTAPNGSPADWVVNVSSQSGIPADQRWFPNRVRVQISGATGGGSHLSTQYQVVDSVPAGAQLTLHLKSLNKASALSIVRTNNPVTGVLTRGIPNVSDYESYCPQIPGLNTRQLTPFWLETTRWSYKICGYMEKYLQAIRENNPYFKQFGDIESVELNRQIQQDFERSMAWAFFFNKPYEHQNLNEYGLAPPNGLEYINVADGAIDNPNGGKIIGRRAAAIGVYEQLAECGRVYDLQQQVLNLPELMQALFQLQKVRRANGLSGDVIEVYTDSQYAQQLMQGLLAFINVNAQGLLRYNVDMCGKCVKGPYGFEFTEFKLNYPSVVLRIVTNCFFDDLLAAHTRAATNLTTPGRVLWFLDWSTIYRMVLETNSVTHRSGDLSRMAEVDWAGYSCVMKMPEEAVKLMSMTWTAVVECPQSSLLLENMSFAVPEYRGVSGGGSSPFDYYGIYS